MRVVQTGGDEAGDGTVAFPHARHGMLVVFEVVPGIDGSKPVG